MTRDEIITEIWALTPNDRTFILRHLCEACLTGQCGAARRQGIDVTFARYREAMIAATGVDCMEKTRRTSYVWARNIIAFEMMNDGYVHREIARRIGLSHSTLTYCRHNVLTMLETPQYYRHEMAMYENFKNAIR